MEWTFKADESKTRKLRVLRIKDAEIIRIVQQLIAKHPTGPIFRNTKGKPWNQKSLSIGFRKLKEKLQEHGMRLDPDACMYSCRHTYAKRTLQGYWTGKMINVDTLAGLMGNSPQVSFLLRNSGGSPKQKSKRVSARSWWVFALPVDFAWLRYA